jgi:alpha-glucosidase (family GH31 glycosyl hydrolase)
MSASLLHVPEGDRNPYEAVSWSRHPLEPQAGEAFRVGVKAAGDVGPVVVEWTSAGRDGRVELDHEGDSWTGELGPFDAGCRYRFIAGSEETDWFVVSIGRWEPISFRAIESDSERISILGDHGTMLTLAPGAGDSLTWSVGHGVEQPERAASSHPGGWSAHIREDGSVLITHGKQRLRLGSAVLRDEREPMAWRLWWALDPDEHILGTGERYDALDQRGRKPDIRVYEQYKGQGSRTYFPVPWLISTGGYGLSVDGATRVQFDLGATRPDRAEVTVPSAGGASGRWYFGSPSQVLQAYASDLGSRPSLPMWAFGPWMSGNEWDSDRRVREVVERTLQEGMPATALVIEAWSDEATFYLFNDTEHDPVPGGEPVTYASMRHGGLWPDPRALVDWLHERGVRVLLWQIPVLKDMEGHEQQQRDVAFADEAGICVGTSGGDAYRNRGWWFPESRVIDFSHAKAAAWWFAKRAYLLDDVGIDGFKTDGGEHLWGRDVAAADGATGDGAANAYPTHYLAAYHDFMRRHGHDQPVTFSRAGFTGSQGLPAHWAGDEDSTWDAYRASLVAGLSASASGVAFWGWDLAGFSGELPSAELYKRSTAMAAFCPIMQYHSEHNEHRQPLADRTPWNVAEHRDDPEVNSIYRFYARFRMNLVPYLVGLGAEAARTGLPMMRAMALEFPNDHQAVTVEDQFMLGPDVLVAPILEPGATERRVYLPEGEWADLWTGMPTTGGWITAIAPADAIPAYIRGGSCIPLWMPEVVELGASVGLPGEGPGRLVLMVAPGQGQSTLTDPISGRTWSVKVAADGDALVVTAIGAPEAVTLWLRDDSDQERLVPLSPGDSSLVIGSDAP